MTNSASSVTLKMNENSNIASGTLPEYFYQGGRSTSSNETTNSLVGDSAADFQVKLFLRIDENFHVVSLQAFPIIMSTTDWSL